MASILAFAEARGGALRKVAYEAVTAARRVADGVGDEVHAVVLGEPGTGGAAAELGAYGADRIVVGESDAFRHYSAEGFRTVVARLIQEGEYGVAVFPGSAMGKDLAPRVAARLGAPYAADVTGLAVEGGELAITRPRYAGKVFSRERFDSAPAILTVRPNVFAAQREQKAGEVVSLDVSLAGADFGAVVREIRAAAGEKLVCLRNDKAKGLLNGGTWTKPLICGAKAGKSGLRER
jgi:electron transfer flavoprotein alpha subunit